MIKPYIKSETAVEIICSICDKTRADCEPADCKWMKMLAEESVDAVPVVHGRFVHDGPRFRGGVDWWHCSNCEKLVSGVEVRYKYCPECGAKMDEKEEGEDEK